MPACWNILSGQLLGASCIVALLAVRELDLYSIDIAYGNYVEASMVVYR